MKQYTFRMKLGHKPLDGTLVTVKAESEEAARKQVVAIIKTATRDLKTESLEFVGTGRMTQARVVKADAQRLGSLGGKKSKRVITPEDQRKMQEARRRKSSENAKLSDDHEK
jgi:hypothetical protein